MFYESFTFLYSIYSTTSRATMHKNLTPSSRYPPTLLSTTKVFSTTSTSMIDVREIVEYVGNGDFYSMEHPVTIVNSVEVITVPLSDSMSPSKRLMNMMMNIQVFNQPIMRKVMKLNMISKISSFITMKK